MNDQSPPALGPRLSSLAGLQQAGVVSSFHFDPLSGLVGITYEFDWLRILKAQILFADPWYVAAIVADDPVALRTWIKSTASMLPDEEAPSEPPPKPDRLHRKRR